MPEMISLNINDISSIKAGDNGTVVVCYKDGKIIDGIKPRRLFPLTRRNKYISLIDSNGEELCIIPDIKALDKESRKNIEAALDRYYFIPQILKIKKIDSKYGIERWFVVTDKGEKDFEVLNNNTDIKHIGQNHYIIIDSDDNRYEIKDASKLDNASRAFLEDRL